MKGHSDVGDLCMSAALGHTCGAGASSRPGEEEPGTEAASWTKASESSRVAHLHSAAAEAPPQNPALHLSRDQHAQHVAVCHTAWSDSPHSSHAFRWLIRTDLGKQKWETLQKVGDGVGTGHGSGHRPPWKSGCPSSRSGQDTAGHRP